MILVHHSATWGHSSLTSGLRQAAAFCIRKQIHCSVTEAHTFYGSSLKHKTKKKWEGPQHFRRNFCSFFLQRILFLPPAPSSFSVFSAFLGRWSGKRPRCASHDTQSEVSFRGGSSLYNPLLWGSSALYKPTLLPTLSGTGNWSRAKD